MKIKLLFVLVVNFTIRATAQYQVLHNFNDTMGAIPYYGELLNRGDGFLYGMTAKGGAYNYGVIFKIKPNGVGYQDLFDFNQTNGGYPYGSLISDGTFLYGMTNYGGGQSNSGNIFKIKPDGTGFQDLYDFDATVWNGTTGGNPYGSLISDGTYFYGMTSSGGANGTGIIFRIKINGTGFQDLFDFSSASGGYPNGSLISDGTYLYGMALSGGANSHGVIFKIKPDGTGYQDLHDFNSTDGDTPYGKLVSDGTYLYGMTQAGGLHQTGALFKIKTDGTSYQDLLDFNGTNGQTPYGSLISDGTFLYGMTAFGGGTNGRGNIFKIRSDGTGFQDLFDFNGTNGEYPYGSLISDGTYLYGMTQSGGLTSTGGVSNNGVIFKLEICGLATPQICEVTTDSASNYNYNIVIWDNTQYNNVDSFFVYRYDAITNNYLKIGVTDKNTGQFIDTARQIGSLAGTNGNPNYGAQKYILTLTDTCGAESSYSPYHLTEFLQDQQNGNFIVSPYAVENTQNNPVTAYVLYKDANNTGNYTPIAAIPSGATTATDPSYLSTASYRVDILGFNCNVNGRYANPNQIQTLKQKSHSNATARQSNGIKKQISNNKITIFPNPNEGSFTVGSSQEIGILEVYNTLNQLVYKTTSNEKKLRIDLADFNAGIYYIHIQDLVMKIVKQ